MEVLYINLDRCVDRKERLEKELLKHNIKFNRIKGIDGTNKDDILSIFDLTNNFYKKKHTRQLGCLGSHLKAINYFIKNSKHEYALILEDDTTLKIFDDYDLDLKFVLNKIVDIVPSNFGIIQLSYIWGSIEPFVKNKNRLYKKWNKYYAANAYIISKKGGNELINKLMKNNKIPLDLINNSMKNYVADYILYKKTKSYTFKIPLFFQNSDLVSIIGSNSNTRRKAVDVMKRVLKEYDSIIRQKFQN